MKTNKNIVSEKRSNPELNVKIPPIDKVNRILKENSVENLFISFRKDLYVTDINKNTKYNTPVGLYTYPLKTYVKKEHFDTMNDFRNLFPFLKYLKNIIFYIAKDLTNVLSVNTSLEYAKQKSEQIYNYAISKKPQSEDKITEYYQKAQKALSDESVYYSEYLGFSNSFAPNVPAATLWYYIYDITSILHSGSVQKGFSIVSYNNGIYGFIDYGLGFIHPNEKAQTVFFSVDKVFVDKEIVVDSTDERIVFIGDEGKKNKNFILINKIKRNPELLKTLKNELKDDTLISLVKNEPFLLNNIIEAGITPSEPVQLAAVSGNGETIKFLTRAKITPSNEVQLKAIDNYGNGIKHLIKAGIRVSTEVQLRAVQRYGNAIEHLVRIGIKPDETMQLASVNNIPSSIRFIKNPTDTAQLKSVIADGYNIKLFINNVNNLSEKVMLHSLYSLVKDKSKLEEIYNLLSHNGYNTPKVDKVYTRLSTK